MLHSVLRSGRVFGLSCLVSVALLAPADPAAQRTYVKASNTDPLDRFGGSVAASSDLVVVGARAEASAGSGPGADPLDDSATNAGAAYVFERRGQTWIQTAYLKASNTDAGDVFGWAVAASGDTIVVGALNEDSGATGVGGDEEDERALGAGAVYVFVRDGSSWVQEAYLKASNTESNDNFGESVAISGDTLIVGASFEDSASMGVNGDPSNNGASGSGAAYVFVRNGSSWSQEAYLKSSNTFLGDRFGCSVAVSGDTAVVGACWEDSLATGVGGDQSDDGALSSGAAYVFVRDASSWSQEAYLKASNTGAGDLFGSAVTLSGETLVVGAPEEDSGATGVDGDQEDEGAADAGAAYVFVRSGSSWSQQAYLKAPNSRPSGNLGIAVAVSDDTIVAGARGDASGATGVNGNPDDTSAPFSGAAHLFARKGAVWSPGAYLKASNAESGDLFGGAVSAAGETIVVGAMNEDGSATGVGGAQGDNGATWAGAAYFFESRPRVRRFTRTVQEGGTILVETLSSSP